MESVFQGDIEWCENAMEVSLMSGPNEDDLVSIYCVFTPA